MIVTPQRTRMHKDAEAACHEATVPGMAHFAGTGPAGTTCSACAHWNHGNPLTIRRRLDGQLRAHPCGMFKALTDADGADIPPATPSCRHFTQSGFHLPLVVEPKKAKP